MRERSLILIKPDAVERNLIGQIINCYEEVGLKVMAMRMENITEEVASKHYAEHKGKAFYDELIKYITRSPLCAIILEGKDAISKIRQLNGHTNPAKAEDGTIRKYFGVNLTENCVHASDSVETAKREIAMWFPN
ncbi:nucleoside-diphosphate kinase [Clostridium vincentii]|uniref:Nucleoside diphosphate kinase n=1 Tax=Clostridium vincentii TaxID=52704 RepID=A0A2T0BJ39_9CLOT|nr:nucleoside-diphosphate kinase [Clostridium vincentii]PRR83890.1 Nucleoside diphosphate kinase [Clostridium vincentii]